MSVSTTFDLLLRGGRVIDPASHIDGNEGRRDPQRQGCGGSGGHFADQCQGDC